MVTISDLDQDLDLTGREVILADDGEFGTTKQIVLTEQSVSGAASLSLLMANYLAEVGLQSLKFADGSEQVTAMGVPAGGTLYLFGNEITDGSLRLFITGRIIFLGLRISGVWNDAPLLSFEEPEVTE